MHIHIHFVNVCNMRCSYCINGNSVTPGIQEFMNKNVLDAAVNFVNRFTGANVYVQGGEPTVYPHVVELVQNLKCEKLYIVTNGLLDDKLFAIIDNCHAVRELDVSVSVHHEYWNAHQPLYAAALLRDNAMLIKFAAAERVTSFNFKLLVDYHDMTTTADIAQWLFSNIDDAHVLVRHVRRTETTEEFMRTYLAARRNLPSCVCEALMADPSNDQLVHGNPFYGKQCKQFSNFAVIYHDGRVCSSFCPQALTADQLITAPQFVLRPCTVICQQKVHGCFDNCMCCNLNKGVTASNG